MGFEAEVTALLTTAGGQMCLAIAGVILVLMLMSDPKKDKERGRPIDEEGFADASRGLLSSGCALFLIVFFAVGGILVFLGLI